VTVLPNVKIQRSVPRAPIVASATQQYPSRQPAVATIGKVLLKADILDKDIKKLKPFYVFIALLRLATFLGIAESQP
jgi:hypothetical protein